MDATRGMRDFSYDLHSLVETLELLADGRRLHLVGWSVGGGVAIQYAIDRPAQEESYVGRIAAVLDAYRNHGGQYWEEVVADCGHSPHIEKPEAFRRLLFAFLEARAAGVP